MLGPDQKLRRPGEPGGDGGDSTGIDTLSNIRIAFSFKVVLSILMLLDVEFPGKANMTYPPAR
jgi:hypothetical protein